MQSEYVDQLQNVFEVQQNISDIHPFLEKVFPIAIVEDSQFFIIRSGLHIVYDKNGKR